jgi:phage shock protein A
MAGIFSRISDIIKANINDILDKSEDPEKMIKQMVIEMEEAVNKATTAVGSAIANEKQLERQLTDKTKQNDEWQQRAVKAVAAGRDDLARQALEKKTMFSKAVTDLGPVLDEARRTSTTMRGQLEQLKAKLDEARVRQGTLIARHQAAQARKQIAQSMSGIGDGAFANFDKYEQKVLKAESEAEAFSELSGQSTSLDEEFKKLESGGAVEQELALLKAANDAPAQK